MAIWISSLSFGIYHWFSFGVLGQPVPMIYVLVITSLAGFIFAYSFYKTRSVYMPFALHFGYNFTNMIVFSNDNGLGKQLLVKSIEFNPINYGVMMDVAGIGLNYLGYPLLAYLLIKRFVKTDLRK